MSHLNAKSVQNISIMNLKLSQSFFIVNIYILFWVDLTLEIILLYKR